MTKRLAKKAENRKRKLIHETLDLVLDINGLGPRRQSLTGSLPTAFLDFFGHVGSISVSLCSDGWESDKRPDWRAEVYICNTYDLKTVVRGLGTVKKEAQTAATARTSNN